MQTILLTGANRGIGLACVACLLAVERRVFATVRPEADCTALTALQVAYPERLTCLTLELSDPRSIAALPQLLAEHTAHLDLLINNAGTMTDHETVATVKAADLLGHYAVNAVAPLLCAQAVLPFLQRGTRPAIVNVSSSFASIGRKSAAMPARYSYAMSKAALNMASKTLALELAPLNIIVAAIHPGWTRTQIGGADASFSPEEAAQRLIQSIDRLTPADTGCFRSSDGIDLPW